MNVPNFITHYNRSEPFRSITSLNAGDRSDLIKTLNVNNTWGLNRFSDPEYLERRLLTEKQMRKEFINLGGKPELMNPVYFFLGQNENFEKHSQNMAHKLYLKDIPANAISFTYGDSMLSYHEDYRIQSGEKYKNILCGKLFRLDELADLFLDSSFPKEEALAIEAHLWIKPSLRSL